MKYDLSHTSDLSDFNFKVDTYIKQGKKVELKIVRETRTVKQNAYLHVCITLFAIEFGYTIEESKTHLKRNCHFMRYEKNGETYLKRTRDMNTEELTKFIEWLRNYSSQKGCVIPSAEEYKENQFNIDREISRFKEYL